MVCEARHAINTAVEGVQCLTETHQARIIGIACGALLNTKKTTLRTLL